MSKSIFERAFDAEELDGSGMDVLEKLTQEEIGATLNEMVNRHPEDLPLVVACIKSSMPHWERAMGESGRVVCDNLLGAMMSVDVTALKEE